MAEKEVILVTGVAGYWGQRVAEKLLAQTPPGVEDNGAWLGRRYHVIGMDREPPDKEIDGLDFIQADVRNPLLVDLLTAEKVHAVCHLAFEKSARPNESAFDANVIGTMKLLGACAEAGVRKVVLKSSMMVYGAAPSNPAFLTEQQPLKGKRSIGSVRDWVEIEAFCNGFRRQVPEMILTVLRFPSIIGPTVETPMTEFLSQPWTPVLLGFNPRMQIIHEGDVVDALVHAVMEDVPGVYNVAAAEVLPLAKLMAIAGKFPLPVFHLFAYWGNSLMGSVGLPVNQYWPLDPDYLRFPWVGSLELMRNGFGFEPRYAAEEALREYAGRLRLRRYLPESAALSFDEERLRDTIERRRRARERLAYRQEGEDEK
ncbi:MAG TPA: NAD-dependent epimerase/dehydratase family protein [Anaerolineales bacterium]|nr:NAD-dependent epimerase/dehydratase family protein [Anaerolineales bacterium]